MASSRITDLPADQRPRERLGRLGADALTDAEVVAVLPGSGSSGCNAIELGQRVIQQVGGIANMATATVDSQKRVPGVGVAGASRIAASIELRRRVGLAERPAAVVDSAGIAAAVLPQLLDRSTERIALVVLDRGLGVIDVLKLSDGAAGHASIPPAELLSAVLRRDGHSFAVTHNHPGGSLEPSRSDNDGQDPRSSRTGRATLPRSSDRCRRTVASNQVNGY